MNVILTVYSNPHQPWKAFYKGIGRVAENKGGINFQVARLVINEAKDKRIIPMRNLVLKNLTSIDKKRRVLSSSETVDNQGIRSTIRRHFICIVREIKDEQIHKPIPYLYILKERNTKELSERFFCKIKGSVYLIHEARLFLIIYVHSLKIDLVPAAG